ncbi:MAG: hypothetical protein ACTSRA_14430 [Promethearchaeota archaeon]
MRIITINLSEPHVKALVDEKKIDDIKKIPQFLKDHLNYSGSVEDKKKEISRLIRKLQYEDQQVASAAN